MANQKLQKLMRTWYETDAGMRDNGTFSAPFPAETDNRRILSVHWDRDSDEVEVTWLIDG